MLIAGLIAVAAVLLDWRFGEPLRLHPLAGFGRLAAAVERRVYDPGDSGRTRRLRGTLSVALLLLPVTGFAAALTAMPYVGAPCSLVLLYLALGHRSLHDHARPVAGALREGDRDEARRLAGRIVSRDPETLNPGAATIESVLENGNDAVFGALFWFAVAGGPGAVLYRLANTLDAMWGYRNQRYREFGWAAARLDDLLNLVPARLTALTYALLGNARQAIRCWRTQAPECESPNAGPVMAAGAGALGLSVGGPARYGGRWRHRPVLGAGPAPVAGDIERALALVRRGLGLWLAVLIGTGVVQQLFSL